MRSLSLIQDEKCVHDEARCALVSLAGGRLPLVDANPVHPFLAMQSVFFCSVLPVSKLFSQTRLMPNLCVWWLVPCGGSRT